VYVEVFGRFFIFWISICCDCSVGWLFGVVGRIEFYGWFGLRVVEENYGLDMLLVYQVEFVFVVHGFKFVGGVFVMHFVGCESEVVWELFTYYVVECVEFVMWEVEGVFCLLDWFGIMIFVAVVCFNGLLGGFIVVVLL